MIKTLYGKDSKGNLKKWTVEARGEFVIVTHGRVGGKMQEKTTTCKPKNVGRANATTAIQQAVLEAQSKYNKQIDKLYRPTIEELDGVGGMLPMLAHDYTKVGRRMTYPLDVSTKLDGVRCIARVVNGEVSLTSRGGKAYPVPEHIERDLYQLWSQQKHKDLVLDGEVYCHGMPLPFIVSAIKKPSAITDQLKYYIFDVPSNKAWIERKHDLYTMQVSNLSSLEIVRNKRVENEDQARELLAEFMNDGFEGIMLRELNGLYKFNHRSSSLMKWKEFTDCEVKVEFVEKDKNEEGVLHVIMKDAKTRFKVKMRGTHEERLFSNQQKLVGKWVTVRYQQLTPYGVPQFPVGVAVRNCDKYGEPLE